MIIYQIDIADVVRLRLIQNPKNKIYKKCNILGLISFGSYILSKILQLYNTISMLK